MKKYYSFLLATAVMLSGATTDALANKTTLHPDYMQKGELPAFNFALNAFEPEKKKRQVTNKASRPDNNDASAIEGTWTFIVGDNYLPGGKGYVSIDFEATVDDANMVTFTNPDFFPIKAKYNPRTHSVSFSKRMVGQEGDAYVFQQPFVYDHETGTAKTKSVLAYFSEYERAIVFEDNIGIALTAYADKQTRELLGYYDMLDLTVCSLPMEGEWKDMDGNALFTDGWLSPAINPGEALPTYEVPVQQSADNENVYRLVNPYKYGPLAVYNESDRDGYIVFDVTDPQHVVFKFADAGFASKTYRVDRFFAYNYMGSLALINPYYTPEEVILEFGKDFPATTFSEGVVSFDMSMTASDVRFGLQDLANSPRFWQDADGAAAKMNAGIVLPGYGASAGLNGMEAAEADAEYFTPQGLRIASPERGQIVIKRQGNTVTKEVYSK